MKLKKRRKRRILMKKSLPLCFLPPFVILVMTCLGEESENEKGAVNKEQQGCGNLMGGALFDNGEEGCPSHSVVFPVSPHTPTLVSISSPSFNLPFRLPPSSYMERGVSVAQYQPSRVLPKSLPYKLT